MRVGLLVPLAIVLAAAPARATPSQDLNRGREAYKDKDYTRAREILNALVYPRELLAQPDELVETYVMLGACLVELGRGDDARREFERALKLEPARELTPAFYSRESIRVFEEARQKLAADAKAIEDARKFQLLQQAIEDYKKSLKVYELHPYSRNFVPFGAGQFQNRTPIRGIVFAATQTVTLATSIGTWFYLINTYGLNARVSREQGISVLRLQRIEVGSGIAFFALYVGGVVDSLLNYKPRVQTEADETFLPPELKQPSGPARPPKKTSLRDRIHLTPLVAPTAEGSIGLGLGIGWEN